MGKIPCHYRSAIHAGILCTLKLGNIGNTTSEPIHDKIRVAYEKAAPEVISGKKLAILMLESALHSDAGAKGTLGLLLSNPACFPFQLPVMTGDFVSRNSDRIEVAH